MGGLDRGPKKSLCQNKDWFFISLSFTWRTGFESCLCLLQIFFSDRHWMCFHFGDAHLAILGILESTLWYLLAQHTAEPSTESSLCTNPTSPFRAVWAFGASWGRKSILRPTPRRSQLSYLVRLPHISICKAEVVILPCVQGCEETDTTVICIIQATSRLTGNCYN